MAKGNVKIRLTDDDYESKGGRKTAPAGTYLFRVHKDSKLKDMASGKGVEVRLEIIGGSGKKWKKYKGTYVFDNIAPTVTWKIAQILKALGIKKKDITMEQFLKLIKGKEIRASIRIKNDEDYGKQNKINQYLPPGEGADSAMDEDEEDGDELEDGDEDGDEDDEDEDDDEDGDDDDDADDDDEDEDEEDEEDEDEDEDDDDEDEDEDDDLDEDDLDEDDDEDEEEEEEEEKPKRGRKPAAKKTAAKKTAAKRGRRK